MFRHVENVEGLVALHDCRVNRVEYKNGVLSFCFSNGFFILNGSEEPCRSSSAQMNCHIVTEDFTDITVNVFHKNWLGKTIRENWSDIFLDAVNSGKYEFEFVAVYHGYQSVLYKGYLWSDKKPYFTECEVELYTDDIEYLWDD